MGVISFPELAIRPLKEARQSPIIDTLNAWGLAEYARSTLLKIDHNLCAQIYKNFDPSTQQSSVTINDQTHEISLSLADVARALKLPSQGYCNMRVGKQDIVNRELFPAGDIDYNRSESAWKVSGMVSSSPLLAIQFLVQYVDLSHQATYLQNRTVDLLAEYEEKRVSINWAKHVHQNLLYSRGYGLTIVGNLKRRHLSLRTGHMLMRITADQIPINVFSVEDGPSHLPLQIIPHCGVRKRARTRKTKKMNVNPGRFRSKWATVHLSKEVEEEDGLTQKEHESPSLLPVSSHGKNLRSLSGILERKSDGNGTLSPSLPCKRQVIPVKVPPPSAPPLMAISEIEPRLPNQTQISGDDLTEAAEVMKKLQQKMFSLYEEVGKTLKVAGKVPPSVEKQTISCLKEEVQRLTELYLSTQAAKNEVAENKAKIEKQISIKEAQMRDQITCIAALTETVNWQKASVEEATEKAAEEAVYKATAEVRVNALENRVKQLESSNEELVEQVQIISQQASPNNLIDNQAAIDYSRVKEEKEKLQAKLSEEREKHRREILKLRLVIDGNGKERIKKMGHCYLEAISMLPLPINGDNWFELDFALLKAAFCAEFGGWREEWGKDQLDYMLNTTLGNKRLRQALCLALATGRVITSENSYLIAHFPCPKSIISSYLSQSLLQLTTEREERLEKLKECNIGQIIPGLFERIPKEAQEDEGYLDALAECMAMQDEGVSSLAPNWNKIDQWASQYENVDSLVNVRSVGKMMLEGHLFWKEVEGGTTTTNGGVIPLGSQYLSSFQFNEPSIGEWNSVRSRLFQKRSQELLDARKE